MNKGAATGLGALVGLVAGPAAGAGYGGPYGLILGILISPATAAGGAVYGLYAGMNRSEYEEITNTLQTVMLNNNVPAVLENECIEAIRQMAPEMFHPPTNAAAGATQTILRIMPLKFGLDSADNGIEPSMTFKCTLQARLLNGSDGEELYAGEFNYSGDTHTLRQWAKNGGSEFAGNVLAAENKLSEQIVERVFLVYPMPANYGETRIVPWDAQ
jgi:hypothetical protein